MIRKINILLVFIILLPLYLFSQQTNFPDDPEKFLKEMNAFLGKNDKSAAKKIMDNFEPVWLANISDDQKSGIYTMANRMLEKRCTAYPHFETFLNSIVAWAKSGDNLENYENWKKGYNNLLKEKKVTIRTIQTYLEVFENLWLTNTIYKSSTTEWRASTPDHKIVIDGKDVKILFGKFDLTCYAKRDSSQILGTEGFFDPVEIKWTGANGKVTWERAGLAANEVYAHLGRYDIDMKKSDYEADSVTFINTIYFNEPLMGRLTEKVVADITPDKASYPQFVSYTKHFQIKNLYPKIDYDGGFSMKGARLLGEGSRDFDAYLTIYKGDTLMMRTASKLYVFRKDRIIGETSAITIYLDKDSIYHPGLTFKFDVESNTVSLIRDKEGIARSPYFNSYHGLEMDFGMLTWKIDDERMNFASIKRQDNVNEASFSSIDYFRLNKYFELQMMDEQNPLVVVRNYVNKYGTEEFTVDEFSNFLRASIPQTKQYLMALAFQGFLTYDFEDEKIKVLPKVYNYIQSSIGKRDYDVITFESKTQNVENAQLSLLTFDLKIKGVPEIFLSDSQNVAIFPRDGEITLKKNRDFEFHGKIRAGYFLFAGSNFYFDYEKFKIELTDVDYVKMRVPSHMTDKNGNPIHVFVKNSLENVTGNLLIDAPDNKSGTNPHPEYPIFNSKKDCYVYYDNADIMGGVYNRSKFYFQIYPFSMDSLDNMTKRGLEFKGYFVSAGIFPPFEDTLRLMPDYSLGFIRKAPPGGYQVYGGKGKFNNDIILSNEGLKGSGSFEYLTSTTKSKDFQFFPDSMNTMAEEYLIKEQKSGVQYPDVKGENVRMHWKPYDDELYTSSVEKPIKMYGGNTELKGTTKLTPSGLQGWGKAEFANAILESELFDFRNKAIDADTARFSLKMLDMADLSFKTDNVNAHVDFEKRIGEFKSNGAASFVEFPQNQYICFMDQFNWYMDKEEIEMSASQDALNNMPANTENLSPTELEDIQLQGSEFISIHPKQDSLKFVAPSAKYSLRKNIITANEVKFIRVADATVYLNDGEVVIEKKAKMQTLINTKIIANTTTRYHTILNATTNIYGKKDYSANGDYDYIDEQNIKQTIHFDVVTVDSSIQTYATGKIGITDGFTLSPAYDYTGDVKMVASNPFLYFDGSVKMKHECEKMAPNWINFSADINPNEIYIPISEAPMDINNNQLHASFMLTNDSAHIYPAFLNKHKNYSDTEMLKSSGFLYFDKSSKKYKISNKEKLIEFNLPGSYLSLSQSICNMYGEGKIDFGIDLGQIQFGSVGNINYDMELDNVAMDIFMLLNFFFNDKALEMMGNAVNTYATEPIEFDRDEYRKGMAELVGEENANEFIANLNLGNFKKFPKELEQSLVISQMNMKFEPATHTFFSEGQIGISNVLKIQVHKFVNGQVEIIKKRSGDILTIYLELSENNWYFFTYRAGVMRTLSSNEEYNALIRDMKPDDRKMNVEKGQTPYSFYPATTTVVKKFLKKYSEEVDDPENPDNTNDDEDPEEDY